MLAKMGSLLYRRRITMLCVILILVIGAAIYGLGVFHFLMQNAALIQAGMSLTSEKLREAQL